MNVRQISINDYIYDLPDEKIAGHPALERDQSKLLVYKNGLISETVFDQLPELLSPGDLLIFNNTKVVRARILFPKPTGSVIEIFCLEPADESDPQIAFRKKSQSMWKVIVGNARRWKEKQISLTFEVGQASYSLTAEFVSRNGDEFIVRFLWNDELTFSEVLNAVGKIPLPPYLKREAADDDTLKYQTVYAKHDGSVAAPTAGLHFTDKVMKSLAEKKVMMESITLHVGAGTFLPVKSELIGEHIMHEEIFFVKKKLVEHLVVQKHRVIATGTTSMRTLESLYWLGVKIITGYTAETFILDQWEAYDLPQNISPEESMKALLSYMDSKKLSVLNGHTKLLIAPGYRIRMTDALITNFHQPGSTLLLLVSAFIGNDWKKIYRYALDHQFRFLSYGDSSILFRNSN